MLEIDIHDFWESEDTYDYSNSVARSGNPDIGRATWDAARKGPKLLKDAQEIQQARRYFGEMVSEWVTLSDNDIQGLTVQEVSHQIQEFESCDGLEDYEAQGEAGQVSGSIFFHNDRMHIRLTH